MLPHYFGVCVFFFLVLVIDSARFYRYSLFSHMYYEPCPVRTRYINSRYDSRSLDENVSSAFCLFVSFDMLVLMVLRNDSYIDVQRYLSSVTFFLLCPRYVLRVYNHDNRFLYYVYINYFITNILRTSAVNSTSFGSILIFASCVVGTCNILYG